VGWTGIATPSCETPPSHCRGRFIATNADRTLPTEIGLIPGAGALVGALEIATDVAPRVIGKPSPDIFAFALDRLGVWLKHGCYRRPPRNGYLGRSSEPAAHYRPTHRSRHPPGVLRLSVPPDWVFRDLEELAGTRWAPE
jgi:hypothetical protein